ncbi:MAG: RidA family protein [Ktedonobacterales bacterium]|nr:RidA family protein [Ktedonobacterales bacterium]
MPNGQVPESFADQCHAVWRNILAILNAAGMPPTNIVKLTTFLTDREQATLNGEIRREYLVDHQPAITVMVAQTLTAPWLLEIEAIAMA